MATALRVSLPHSSRLISVLTGPIYPPAGRGTPQRMTTASASKGLRRFCLGLAAMAAIVTGAAGEASASELIHRNAGSASLNVNGSGHAIVSWRANGATRSVIASGAINARPPRLGVPQVSFRLRYGGKSIVSAGCRRYDGPPLAWLVRACKAPDGSYWALQRWQRLKPNYGGRTGDWELRLSHWTGALAALDVRTDWAYRRYDHLYGRYTYLGAPVFGFRTSSQGSPLDAYGRNVFVDTFNSRYGKGWRRENSFVAQNDRRLLLRLLPARLAAGRQGHALPRDRDRPGSHPRRDVGRPAPGPFDTAPSGLRTWTERPSSPAPAPTAAKLARDELMPSLRQAA